MCACVCKMKRQAWSEQGRGEERGTQYKSAEELSAVGQDRDASWPSGPAVRPRFVTFLSQS